MKSKSLLLISQKPAASPCAKPNTCCLKFSLYSKTCLKRNAIFPVFFFPRFHMFPFYKGLCFNKTKYKKYYRLGLQWRNNLK